MKKKMITLIILLSSIFLLILLFGASVKYYFWEPYNVAPSTFAYHIKIPNSIKKFPIWKNINIPKYSLVVAQGLQNQVTWVKYQSKLSISELVSLLEKKGMVCSESIDNYVKCNKKHIDSHQSAYLKGTNSKTNVEISFMDLM